MKNPRPERHTLNLQVEIAKGTAIVVRPGHTAGSPPQFVLKPMELDDESLGSGRTVPAVRMDAETGLDDEDQGSGGIIVCAHKDVVAGLGAAVIRSILSSRGRSVSVTALPGETVSIKALGELANRTQRDVVLHVRSSVSEGGEK